MKKYNNYCVVWNEDGTKKENIIFHKVLAIKDYVDLLLSGRDISDLKIIGITKRDFKPEDITNTVNKFLNN